MTVAPSAEPSLARLQEHTAFIQRVARALVQDAATADDLVQEAWIAALQAKGPIRSPRAWFSTVLRNLARQRFRTDARRSRREEASSIPEGNPETPDAVAERFETGRLVADHVAMLEDPYRRTVLLHYFDELSLADIARRENVPASTVRWRLKRALEQLRERLDQVHGGDRRRWCLALVPLAVPRVERTPLWLSLAAATLLLGIGSIGIWSWVGDGVRSGETPDRVVGVAKVDESSTLERADDAPPSDEPTDDESTSAASSTTGAPPVPADEDPLAEPTPTARSAGLVGRFVDTEGEPIEGVKLDPGNVGAGPFVQTLVEGLFPKRESGADGTIGLHVTASPAVLAKIAKWSGAEVGAEVTLSFEARREGYQPTVFPIRLQDGVEYDFGTKVLHRVTRLTGTVVDADGAPIERATIYATKPPFPSFDQRARTNGPGGGPQWIARTDADGRFEAKVHGGFQRVWAVASGRHFAWTHVQVTEGQDVELEPIVLQPRPGKPIARGFTATVLVTTPDGVPFPGARVTVKTDWYTGVGATQTDGSYELSLNDRPDQSDPLDVWVSDPSGRWGPAHAHWSDLFEESTLTIALVEREMITVRVEGPGPEQLEGLRIRWSHGGASVWATPIESAPNEYSVDRPLPGSRLEVDLDGYQPQRVEVPEGADRIVVRLSERAGLRGRVLAAGAPVAGASILLQRWEPGESGLINGFFTEFVPRLGRFDVQTDAEGQFGLYPEEPGRYVIFARAEGWASALSAPFDYEPGVDLEPIEVELTAGATIVGRVTTQDPQQRVGGTVVGINAFDGWPLTQRVGEDGYFRFENLRPGPWRVSVRSVEIENGTGVSTQMPGISRPEPSFQLSEGETRSVEVALDRVRIRGRVVGLDDTTGWTWTVSDPFDLGDLAQGRVGEDGQFTPALAFARRAVLVLQAPGGEFGNFSWIGERELTEGVVDWSFAFALAPLAGRVHPGQETSGGLSLECALAGGTVRIPVEIDSNGEFRALLAPEGRSLRLVRRQWQEGGALETELTWERRP